MSEQSTSYAERVRQYEALIAWYRECPDDEFVAYLRDMVIDGSFVAFETMRRAVLDKVDLLVHHGSQLSAGELSAIKHRLARTISDTRDFLIFSSATPVVYERLVSLPLPAFSPCP